MKHKKTIALSLSIAFIALSWEFVARKINLPAIFPSLEELFRQLFLLFGTKSFYIDLLSTLYRGLAGLFIAFICSFALGTLAAFSVFWKTFFQPIIAILRSVPVISFVLLALLWFSPPKLPIFIALITTFPILFQNISTALNQTDIRLVELAKVFGKNPVSRFFTIYLPASKELIYDGLSTAMGFGWRAVIIGEVLAQPIHGIGTGMKEAQAFIQIPKLMAWTIIAIAISYLFDILLQQIRKVKFVKKLPIPQSFSPEKTEVKEKEISIVKLNKRFDDNKLFEEYSNIFTNSAINCIKGESGRGKTTLLRMISGLDKNYGGRINIPESYTLSYSFQESRLLPWLTVKENIAYIINKKKRSKQYTSNILHYLLDKCGLSEHADKYPRQLSGGQQQRVNLVRALAAQADILLLDEPLTGLDEALKKHIMDFLSDWIAVYRPVVVWVTHENIMSESTTVIDNHIF